MKKTPVDTPLAPRPVGAYSQGMEWRKIIYFSGQIGVDITKNSLAETFEDQLREVLKNIDGLLKAQGLERTNVLKTTVFLTDLGRFPEVNKAYSEYFSEPYPARSCVEVSKLPLGSGIEIEVTAFRP